MKKILLGIAAAALAPTLTPAFANVATTVAQNNTSNANIANWEPKLHGLSATQDQAWVMYNSGDTHSIIKKENIEGGVGDCFNQPKIENFDTINMSTTYHSTRERFMKQKFSFNVIVPANTDRISFDLKLSTDLYGYLNGHFCRTDFSGCIELFNQGTDWEARPGHYVNYTDKDPAKPDSLSVGNSVLRGSAGWSSKTISKHEDLVTTYTLSNPTNQPIEKTCYFTIAMYIRGTKNSVNGNTGFSLTSKASLSQTVINSIQTNSLKHYDYYYHSGEFVGFEQLQHGCGPMFAEPVFDRNPDKTYHLNLRNSDKRQNERLIYQSYALEVDVPAHSCVELAVKFNGKINASEEDKCHDTRFDATVQLFDLGSKPGKTPYLFTNHNFESLKDSAEVDERHVYKDHSEGGPGWEKHWEIWENQDLTLNLYFSNSTDKTIKENHYFAVSMFVGGYEKEICNFEMGYDATVSLNQTIKPL